MNRGPVSGTRQDGKTSVEKVIAGSPGEPADWLLELARLADAEGFGGAAKRIGYSRSVISVVLSGTYRGDLGRVEQMVRGALMSLTVDCPVLGEIGRDRCLDWQKKPYAPTSSHRVQMYTACRNGCPNAKLKTESEPKS